MDAPLPRDLRTLQLRFQVRALPPSSAVTPCGATCLTYDCLLSQSALRNLEAALEPVLKLTVKELDGQASVGREA